MQKIISILFLAILLSFGCGKDGLSSAEQLAEDIQKIEQYLADNNLTAQKTSSGLHYIIEQAGIGTHPNIQSQVTVVYKGYLLDGSVFDQTPSGQTTKFGLNQVIPGWGEGLQLFKAGGSGKLLIPSALAYRNATRPGIPANSVLVFDISLLDF